MGRRAPSSTVSSVPWMVGQAVRASGFGVLDDTGQAVVIGQGECLQTQLDGGGDKVLRLVGAIEEGIGGMSVKLGVAMSRARQASVVSPRLALSNICTHYRYVQRPPRHPSPLCSLCDKQ